MNKSNNYSKLKKEIVEQHNTIRKNPKSYIPLLEKQMKYFKGNIFQKPGSSYGIETHEGKSAYEECVTFLKTQKAVGELTFDDELAKAPQDHAEDIGESGTCDHYGTDGSSAQDRISRYIEWDITLCENIDFGATSAEDIIISLIVDDGVSNRGHRKNIFNPSIKFIGVGVANHAEFGICTVLDYCGGILSYKSGGKSKLKEPSKPSPNLVSAKSNKNDHLKSIKNYDEEEERLRKLREAIISRDKSNTSTKKDNTYKLEKDFNNKVNLKGNSKKVVENDEDEDEDDPFKNDPDAPPNAIAVSIKTVTKKTGKKTEKTTIKTYTLDDGTKEIVELVETNY